MAQNLFNSVKGLKPKLNAFPSFTYRNDFTGRIGELIPCYIEHTVPGSHWRLSANALTRLTALVAPIMDNVDQYVHFWKIPYRLLENGAFTQFVGGEIADEEYDPPYITGKHVSDYLATLADQDQFDFILGNGALMDFLGWDSWYFANKSQVKTNIRELQAYAFLLLHWYINEHIMPWQGFEDDVQALLSAQGDASEDVCLFLYDLCKSQESLLGFFAHGWQKDYFTSALPNVQEGDPVTLGLAGSAPVTGKVPAQTAILNPATSPAELAYIQATMSDGTDADGNGLLFNLIGGDSGSIDSVHGDQNHLVQLLGKLEGNTQDHSLSVVGTADLSEASAITINELRVANALQIFKERVMRFGHRSNEYYKGFFNVEPEDLRLQLPKYLGGGRIPVNISDIEQTSSTDATSPQGNLAGKGTAVAGGFAGFTTFCSEECVIIGVTWLMPKQSWVNSMRRFKFKLNDRYDYFNPSFEHLGEQEIMKCEVFAGGSSEELGYTPRFAEYRFHQNEVHGRFKDNLSFWHMGRMFTSAPSLSADFIYMQPAVFDRVFAVSGAEHYKCSMIFNVQALNPISKYGTPMLLA